FEPRGVLRVGAPADLASWHVEALAVQAPDERAAHWSTDERAGTPLLPFFGAGEPAPRLLRLWQRGVELETSGGRQARHAQNGKSFPETPTRLTSVDSFVQRRWSVG